MGYKSGYETRNKIYRSALSLFTTHGYYKTTMRMIAASADVNLGLCHYHFQKKENIVKRFYSRYHERLRNLLAEASPRENPFACLIQELTVNYFLLFSSRLFLTLFLEGISVDDISREYSAEKLEKMLGDRISGIDSADRSYFLMGSVFLGAQSQIILKKWREKKLDRTPGELIGILLRQFTGYFGFNNKETDKEIGELIKSAAALEIRQMERELIRFCLEEDCMAGD